MTRINITDILGIGAQRAMTTWLHQLLSAHPGVATIPNFDPVTSTNKEAHFWDWNHWRGADWYRVLMRPLRDDLKSLDITPDYALMNEAQIAECKVLNPSARVIYILRDPLARAVSAIRMRTLWRHGNAAADSIRLSFDHDFQERCRNANLFGHGAFSANLARWRARFPDLLLLTTEDIAADPMAAAARILDHCGLPMPEGEARERLHQAALNRVWATPPYPLNRDCLDFLDGLTWFEREALAAQGLTFTEGESLREALA